MNKLFTKIAALSLGAAMAVGVGIAASSKAKDVEPGEAASAWQAHTGALTSGNEYLIVSVDSSACMQPKNTSSSGSSTTSTGGYSSVSFTAASGPDMGFTFTGTGTTNQFYIKDGTTFVYASGTTNNGLGSKANGSGSNDSKWTVTETSTSGQYTIISASNRQLSKYSSNWRSYSNTSGSRTNVKIYEKASTKTLSSISVSGYTTSFTVGDTFSFGGTVTATYSDSTSANVTSGTTFSGYNMNAAGNYTVTASYTEGGVTKTATYPITVAAATSPTLSFDKASFSGYTGQSLSITATFANLESDLAWSASGEGSITGGNITWSSSDHRNGTSTYTCTLSGEGGKTIVADATGVNAAQCVVTITQTTVDITKASTSIAVGRSETLAVSHNASSVGGVTWDTSNSSVATVASNGKVTIASGASVGATVTITATSSVDTNVSDTCTITVAARPLEDVLDSSVIPDAAVGSGTSSWGTASTFSDYTGAVYTGRFMGVSSASFIGRLNDSTNGYIYTSTVPTNMKLVSVSIESMTASKTVGVYAQTGAYTAAPSDKSTALGTITPSSLTYTFDENSNYNAICLRGHTSATEIGTVTITYQAEKTLSNITLSGTYPTTFTKGDTFSHSGMVVTANYSDSTSATVTGSATWSSPDMSTPGTKTVTVSYSDEHGSASKTYQITVSYADPTSITLSQASATVALEETFNLTNVSVTINPSETADQSAYAWSLYDDGDLVENEDYVWISPEIMSYSAGTFIFRCTSTEDGTKYAEFTLTVSGDPIAQLKDEGDHDVTGGSMSVYADAGIISFSVITENFQGTLTYTWSSSNTSIISVDSDADDMCDYEVKAAGSARLSCRIQGSVKGDVTVYVDVTVSAVSVTSVTWTAPTIDVFSGATITTSDVSSWNVRYSTDSGKTDQTPAVGDVSVKVNGSVVSLPYTWKGSDNGHTLGVSYGGVSSSTTTVTVTQTINAVYAPNTSSDTVSWTASEAADLGSKISSQGGTDEGTISTGDYEWDYTRTLVSLASNKSDYIAFQGETWIQLGSGNSLESIEFTTSAITGTIKSVSVVAATAGTHALTIDVGGTKYLEDESLHVYTGTAAADNPDPADCVKTGTGSSSGTITITIAQSGSTKKAMVIRSISVTYETEGSGTTNIANNASHKAAQRAAVAFAQAFNAAMDETENCTTGLDAAWSTCSSAYTSFCTAAAALGETEEAWAKNLVKYATRVYSDDSAEACLERMMKTYEICVQKHGKTAFMSDLVTLGRVITPVNVISNSGTEVAIIVVTSMIGLSAVGGYFFLRKRKENI